jgi:Na+-transporting NADH:ubiquinone oxidoreductase subunit NqrA
MRTNPEALKASASKKVSVSPSGKSKLTRRQTTMNASDTAKVQRYLRQRFGNNKLSIARRENKEDSADLMLEDEFIGVVFQDNEDGETCYHVQISILEEDLDDVI